MLPHASVSQPVTASVAIVGGRCSWTSVGWARGRAASKGRLAEVLRAGAAVVERSQCRVRPPPCRAAGPRIGADGAPSGSGSGGGGGGGGGEDRQWAALEEFLLELGVSPYRTRRVLEHLRSRGALPKLEGEARPVVQVLQDARVKRLALVRILSDAPQVLTLGANATRAKLEFLSSMGVRYVTPLPARWSPPLLRQVRVGSLRLPNLTPAAAPLAGLPLATLLWAKCWRSALACCWRRCTRSAAL